MKSKQEIVDNWLPRYTGVPLDQFGQHILLTNFGGYLHTFSELTGAPSSAWTGRWPAPRSMASP
jgi:AMP nucleosidase